MHNEILKDIIDSHWLEREVKKIIPRNSGLRDDFFQEICLIILEYKANGPLQEAWLKRQHLPFIKRIIMNQANSKTSPFYKKYKKNRELSILTNDIEEND